MVKIVLAIAAAGLLAACADMPRPAIGEEQAVTAGGYGRAFGRVQYLENGRQVAWRASLFHPATLTLFVRSAAGGPVQYLEVEDDGNFHWPLRAGEYLLAGFQLQRAGPGASSRFVGRIMTSFSVPEAGQAAYVGDLHITAERGGYRFNVLDRYDEAIQKSAERLAQLQPTKALMRAAESTGSYRRVVHICSGIWQIDCQGKYQGVEPVKPPETAGGFPEVESLAPRLEWKPVNRVDVSYDVAVYESLNVSIRFQTTLRGPMVAYAEGLRDPRYTPQGLLPGRRYEWTVRLRDKDIVSSWSTSSETLFLLIAGRRETGQTFGFTTPSN